VKSALYRGRVRHRRFTPVEHAFEYRMFYLYLDLDELPRALDRLPGWSARRPALARFAREDHFGDPSVSLDQAVRGLVEEQCGVRPSGPIRLLAMPRTLGFSFNPVSFFFCFATDGELTHIVAEVDNTPWGERHCYAVDVARDGFGKGRQLRFRVPKAFHVSPFHPMRQEYEWKFTKPGRSLVVHMENWEDRVVRSDATLVLRRQALDPRNATLALLRHPAMALSVLRGIYAQAARLWIKGARYHPHPKTLPSKTGSRP
jgi:DUF1365 family protein